MQCTCAVLSSVACPAERYSSTLFHKRYDLRKKNIENKMCVLILSKTFGLNISLSKKTVARYGSA
jgi:hypothetical protein